MKRIIACVVALILLISGVMTGSAESTISVTFLITDGRSGETLSGPLLLTVKEGETALSILEQQEESTQVQQGAYGAEVISIFGLDKSATEGWTYLVNDKLPPYTAGRYTLRDGDRLEWKFVSISASPTTSTTKTTIPASSEPTVSQSTQSPIPTGSSGPINGADTASSVTSGTVTDISTATQESNTTRPVTTTWPLTTVPLSKDVEKIVEQSADYLSENPGAFTALALRLVSRNVPHAIKEEVREQANNLSQASITDLERIIINLTAIGENPNDYNGSNLCHRLLSTEDLFGQGGFNGVVFALLALGHAQLDGTERNTSDSLVNLIIQNQKADGSFSLTFDGEGDVDITAMTLTALSDYRSRADVMTAIDKGLDWLADHQNSDGSFNSNLGVATSESTAQVIIALSSLDIDPTDSRFMKNDNMFEALLRFADDQGFRHVMEGQTDPTATEQALLAIASYQWKINPYSAILPEITDSSIGGVLQIVGGILFALILVCGVVFFILRRRVLKKTLSKESSKNHGSEVMGDLPKGYYMPDGEYNDPDSDNSEKDSSDSDESGRNPEDNQ